MRRRESRSRHAGARGENACVLFLVDICSSLSHAAFYAEIVRDSYYARGGLSTENNKSYSFFSVFALNDLAAWSCGVVNRESTIIHLIHFSKLSRRKPATKEINGCDNINTHSIKNGMADDLICYTARLWQRCPACQESHRRER